MMALMFQLSVGVLWMTTVGMMIVKTHRSTMTLYRIQALMEALLAALMAVTVHLSALWISVLMVIVIKIIVIPTLVTRTFHNAGKEYSAKSPLGMGSLLMLALLLSVGGLLLGRLGMPHPTVVGLVLGALFVSFLHVSSRYELWSVLWAVLSLDTVVGAGALIFGTGLPETADVGINLASLTLALVLAYVGGRIERIKNSLDVRELEELIG